MKKNQTGLIHTIERFSTHDGPGIRSLVVMKGCPLKCRWCSSPYTQSTQPEILYVRSHCKSCGTCIDTCPQQALSMGTDPVKVHTDRSLCTGCGDCVEACVYSARELSGRYYTTEELLHEVKKDEAFFRRSGGGITVGGGEPTMQAEFVGAFLTLCRENGFHTAMETCSMTSWDRLALLLDQLDLVYMDLKHMDSNRHKEWTGVSNKIILENIQKAAKRNRVILRIPVIPGFNDSEENISNSSNFTKKLGGNVIRLELLPYHQFGIHRYEELDRTYDIGLTAPPSEARLMYLRDIARSFGVGAQIGGEP